MRLNEFCAEIKRLTIGFQRYMNADDEMKNVEQDFEEWKEQFDIFTEENQQDEDGWG